MDVADKLKALSQPHGDGEKIVSIIERTARAAGLSYSRCYEIWYRRARSIERDEVARIDLALDRKDRRDARNEFSQLWNRIAVLEARFKIADEDFHREDIDALRQSAGPGRLVPSRSR